MPSLPLPLSVSQAAEAGGLQSTPTVGGNLSQGGTCTFLGWKRNVPKEERLLSSIG